MHPAPSNFINTLLIKYSLGRHTWLQRSDLITEPLRTESCPQGAHEAWNQIADRRAAGPRGSSSHIPVIVAAGRSSVSHVRARSW
uniref:Uncharacterized protein n=1 Tax=Physcomitrium patens TaxID=3218 RepID=A0A2K1L3T3_PHYPA|nr:hypothetical protein PHYPA_003475 [Physcomitrium patens]